MLEREQIEMSAIIQKFKNKHADRRVLVVTAGLPSKRSFLLEAFKDMCGTDAVYGKGLAERRVDVLMRPFGFGRMAANDSRLNDAILAAVRSVNYDLVCVIKGLDVRRRTLEAARSANPRTRIVLWTCDDQALPHNQSATFLDAASAYDMVFTAKSHNVRLGELERIGFRKVEFLYQAYSEHDHFPISNEASPYKGTVLFIGYAEGKRFAYMNHLAANGIPVEVYGNGWGKPAYERCLKPGLNLHRRPLLGRDYAEALTNAAVNLCFLREQNRDLHTSRTFEIPACCGFMLAERTEEHAALFEEGRDAEFFASKDELLAKVRHYLDHPAERAAIAASGYRRTRDDGYSYHHMVDHMLAVIDAHGNQG